jgi:predicted helicase
MRFGQWWVERHPAGIMAFITNNTYIDGITHRRMRQSLLETFTHIYILDLHGNARKREHAPGGGRDENVFDIQQGVAIGLFVRVPGSHGPTAIYHADMWGTRQEKYDHLATSNVTTTAWKPLRSRPEWFMFVPRNIDSTDEYATFWKLSDIFTVQQNSIKTDRDSLFVDMERETLEQRIQTFYSAEGLRSPFRETYRVENSSSYDILSRRLNTSFNPNYIRRCLYRPFDIRWMYYAPGITSRPAWRVMRHLLAGENIALVGMRQYEYRVQSYCYVYVTEHITESRVFISNRGAASVFPLYVYSEEGERESGEDAATGCNRTHNFAPAFVAAVEQYLGLSCTAAGSGNLEHTVGPEDLFHYLYAVLHIPTYRRQYADSLKVDFPRIPLPRDRATFAALVAHGALLLDLHLLRVPGQGGVGGCGGSAVLAHPTGQGIMLACQGERMTVGTPRYHAPHNSQPGHIAITPHQHIEGVDAETWTMQLGGYYPLEKWLKDRRGRILTDDELRHYLRMVLALRETRRIMRDLDNYWTAIAR